jgi:FlhB-like protein
MKRALALKYDEKQDIAPRVVAKGAGKIAEEIENLAAEHGVPIVNDRLLLDLLYPVEPGQVVPEEFYEPVARLLAWIWLYTKKKGEEGKGVG